MRMVRARTLPIRMVLWNLTDPCLWLALLLAFALLSQVA